MVAAAALLALTACSSPERKAAKAAARFDVYYAQRDFYSARVEIRRALDAQDDVPEYWARLARLELATGRLLQAYDAYARVVELDPKNEEAVQTMAELSYSGGSFDDAEKLADQILEEQPRSLRMLLVKGSVSAERERLAEARDIAERMLAIDPANEGAKILLARVLRAAGDRAGAIAVLRRAIEEDGETIPKLTALLDLHTGAGDFRSTARTFARLFALSPRDAGLRLEYARLLYERGMPDRALAMLARLMRTHADDTGLQQRIVALWTEIGAHRVDVEAIRRFVARNGNEAMKVALGQLLLDSGRPAEAEAVLRPFIDGEEAITAARVEADVLYAGALAEIGRGREALALIDRVLRFDSGQPRALLMRARIAMARGDLAGALRDAQLLIRDNPRLVDAHIALARIYVRRKEPILADKSYATGMRSLPDDPVMLAAYTGHLTDTGRGSAALDIAARFTRDNPRSREGWRERARLCRRLGDEACVAEVRDALAGLPGGAALLASIDRGAGAAAPRRAGVAAGQAASPCGRAGARC